MMRVSIAERLKLSVLIGRRAFRSLIGSINTHPLLRWQFGSGKTDRLVIAPQDLRTADATRAGEIYAGRFAFAGKVVICDRRSPFEMTPPSDEWAVILLNFSWLRHLRAADSAITRANARSLIEDWISLQGGWHATGWRLDILSRRIVCWLSQAPFLLQDADAKFYRRFIRSLSRQVRYLRRSLNQSRDGLPRLQAMIALNYATLCLQGQSGHLTARWAAAGRRAAQADLARRRPYQPQPRRADRIADGPVAAAAIVFRAQPAAAVGAQQRHRPHDADAALLPPRRRQFRAVQRHGADGGRPARHRARL